MIVVTQKCGQLGNRLILGAHLIALANEFGWRFCYPAFCDYQAYFEGPAKSSWCVYPPTSTSRGWLKPSWTFRFVNVFGRIVRRLRIRNQLIQTLTVPGDDPQHNVDLATPEWRQRIERSEWVFLFGWRIRNYQLVKKHQNDIRGFFQPIRIIRQRISEFVQSVRSQDNPLVGVHIRQGDYKTFLAGRYYFDANYYAGYMCRIAHLLGNSPVFLVCSDTPQSKASFPGLNVHFGPGHLVEDMYVLAACDLILGVPSTFCRWAAFFGRSRLCLIDGIRKPEELALGDFLPQGDQI